MELPIDNFVIVTSKQSKSRAYTRAYISVNNQNQEHIAPMSWH